MKAVGRASDVKVGVYEHGAEIKQRFGTCKRVFHTGMELYEALDD